MLFFLLALGCEAGSAHQTPRQTRLNWSERRLCRREDMARVTQREGGAGGQGARKAAQFHHRTLRASQAGTWLRKRSERKEKIIKERKAAKITPRCCVNNKVESRHWFFSTWLVSPPYVVHLDVFSAHSIFSPLFYGCLGGGVLLGDLVSPKWRYDHVHHGGWRGRGWRRLQGVATGSGGGREAHIGRGAERAAKRCSGWRPDVRAVLIQLIFSIGSAWTIWIRELIVRLIDWLVGPWLFDLLIDWSVVDCLIYWLIEWYWFAVFLPPSCDQYSKFCCLYHCRPLGEFIFGLYNAYVDLYFTYLEINPLG